MPDLAVVGTQVTAGASATQVSKLCSVAVTAGQVVYQTTTNQWALADANVTIAESRAAGITVNSAAAGQPAWVVTEGPITLGAGAAPVVGTVYFVSPTAGGIAPTADVLSTHWVTVLGVGIAANQLNVMIIQSGVQRP